ncbi:hypothetical protein PA0697 [Candidatus Phytoplasma australiense]|uniref:Uncharacterized protein n=1 Tax=Phytoplasma australiense TaxID=59748 RepID=B1VAQ8_PHYAS|nr:hypothetical protein PA0697 [Candidatus Phytoplasma australiense]
MIIYFVSIKIKILMMLEKIMNRKNSIKNYLYKDIYGLLLIVFLGVIHLVIFLEASVICLVISNCTPNYTHPKLNTIYF